MMSLNISKRKSLSLSMIDFRKETTRRSTQIMTRIQTVWLRVITFIWLLPPARENNLNLKLFFLHRIAAVNRRTKKVPRILARKYIKRDASSPVSSVTQEQLRIINRIRFVFPKYFYLWIISNKGASLRYLASLMPCMMTMRVT